MRLALKNPVSVVVHALIGWAFCGAVMGIGLATLSLQSALVLHALAAPILFAGVSLSYFNRPDSYAPLMVAITFVVLVMAVDCFLVALVINRSLEMFSSLLGTWIPFALIFASTFVTGSARAHRQPFLDNRNGG